VNSVENVPIDPYEQDGAAVMANAQTIDYNKWKNDLVIELAVFADAQLWARYVQKFGGDASRQLQDFITSILNNVFYLLIMFVKLINNNYRYIGSTNVST